MKINLVFALVLVASSAFGTGPDGSISKENAKRAAFLYASDNVFQEVLDHDSYVVVRLDKEDANAYNFVVSANSSPYVCLVAVKVSKETGMTFHESPMLCGYTEDVAE